MIEFDDVQTTEDGMYENDNGGKRDSADGKLVYTLIPIPALRRVAQHYKNGMKKYGRNNWHKLNTPEDIERYKQSMYRHLIQYLDGEKDEDHLSAVVWNAMALLYYEEKDEEYKNGGATWTRQVASEKILRSIIEDMIGYMIIVQGGSFQMGSNDGEDDENPVHEVTVSPFMIGKYPVTQKEWQDVMGSNPSNWKDNDLPVESISWYDAIVYCNKRSIMEGLTPCYSISGNTDPNRWGTVPTSDNSIWDAVSCDWSANGYRLPTEAEWEYAARGGNKSKGYKYSGSNELGSVAWYGDNSGSKTHSVGGKQANELGIYDMTGNIWEWCWDWYDSGYYSKSESRDPRGSGSGSYRLLRGGAWGSSAALCRVSNRGDGDPYLSVIDVGFRLCRAIND